jgi:hypothetical protein
MKIVITDDCGPQVQNGLRQKQKKGKENVCYSLLQEKVL